MANSANSSFRRSEIEKNKNKTNGVQYSSAPAASSNTGVYSKGNSVSYRRADIANRTGNGEILKTDENTSEEYKLSHGEWARSVNSILLDAGSGAKRSELTSRLESVINSSNDILDSIYSGSYGNEAEFAQGVYDTAMKLRDYYLGNSDELPDFYDVSDSGKANNSAQHWMAQADAIMESMKYNKWDYSDAVQSLLDAAQSSLEGSWGSSGYLWPVNGTITSGFGYRTAPTAGASTYHQAVDIGAAEGTPIYAAADGVVNFSGANGGYGNTVRIGNDDGLTMRYSHMASYAVLPGQRVKRGDVIGYVGQTGTATGPHLDFGVYDQNGNAIDPTSLTYGNASSEDNQKLFDDMQAAIDRLYSAYNQSNESLQKIQDFGESVSDIPHYSYGTAHADEEEDQEKVGLFEWLKLVGSGAAKQWFGSTKNAMSPGIEIMQSNIRPEGRAAELEDTLTRLQSERDMYRELIPDDNPRMIELDEAIASTKAEINKWKNGAYKNDLNAAKTEWKNSAQTLVQSGAEDVEIASAGRTAVGKLLTNGAVAGAQMLMDLSVGAVTGGGSMAPMLVRSFGSGAMEAEENGMGVAGQIANGVKSAAIEWFTEKLFGGNPVYDVDAGLVNKLAARVIKNEKFINAISSAPAEVLSEGLEEIMSDVLNPVVDQVAKWLGADVDVEWPTIDQLIEDGVIGAMLGGVMTGAAKPFQNIAANRDFTESTNGLYSDAGNVRALAEEGLELDPENKTASKVINKIDSGKKVSTAEVRKLFEQNEQNIVADDKRIIREAAADKLAQYGETGDVAAIAEAVAKFASGEQLTQADRRNIFQSKYGQRVANELDPARIRDGGFNSEWAEGLNTSRINANEYGLAEENTQSGTVGDEYTTALSRGSVDSFMRSALSAQNMESAQQNGAVFAPNAAANIAQTAAETAPAGVAAYAPVQTAAPNAAFNASNAASNAANAENALEAESNATASVTIEDASKKYGKQAGAFVHTFNPGQDVAKYDAAYQSAFNYGATDTPFASIQNADSISYLTDVQRELAYEAGQASARGTAAAKEKKVKGKANGKTGRRIGAVKWDGVTMDELNEQQKRGARVALYVAEATGYNIVLYKSELGKDMLYHNQHEDSNGKFNPKEPDTIYIDINAGLINIHDTSDIAKYTVLRALAHELAHTIEYWNPVQYNELRKLVFDELVKNGEDVDELVTTVIKNQGLSYEAASREVVAEALTDILPDSSFIQNLAENHKSLFRKLLDEINKFVADLKEYFKTVGANRDAGANALRKQVGDTVKYLESIVEAFDRAAAGAVENFQRAYATEETAPEAKTAETSQAPVKENAEVEEETAETPKVDFAESFANASREEKDEVIRALGHPSAAVPTEIIDDTTTKEEKDNGKESLRENNAVPVLQPQSDGEGASRLLDEVQAGDVQRAGGQRETVAPAAERGGEDQRDRDQQSVEPRDSGSNGTGESGDLRRNGPELTEEEQQTKVETLQEEVSEQIEQQSTVTPKGGNFVIGESLDLPKGEKARFGANVEAIRLVKKLNTEGRFATPEEQTLLSKYVGWGGLSNAFGEMRWNSETRQREMTPKSGWEKEFAELRSLVDDGTITEEEYKAMSASTTNAHYTDVGVIKAMYDGLAQLGFTGGRMLEPSSGVGNFVGAMPESMSRGVRSWTMVELDRITGQIAKYLYPNADVRIQGFETANIPDNYMDVAIGNVPFGDYGIVDRAYPKRMTKAIHNYFFAKTMDKVRPGGLVMFITSSYTMNSQDTAVRQYIKDRADLLGAIRLPNNAFSGNAGTDVVTDILVLKKRAAGTEYAGEAFLDSPYTKIGEGWDGYAYVNEYFAAHPEMVLGTAVMTRGMYRVNELTYNPLEGKGPLADQIREAFKNITGKMDYKAQTTPEKANFATERAEKKTKQGGLEVRDGKVYRNENGQLSEVTSDQKTAERVSGLLSIRDAYRNLVDYLQQGQDEKFIRKARTALNKAYDDFVNKYGPINAVKNKSAIADDPDSYSLLSLENYDAAKKTATKADIFTKNTITPNRTVTHVDDVQTGIIVSINRTGGIDPAMIAKLTGKTEADVTREMIDSRMAFKTKDGGLEAPETYLSGNVRAKLREAEALAPIDKDFRNNVDELRRVIPEDIPFNDVFVSVGAPWVPNSVYADFIAEMLGGINRYNSYSGPDVTVGRTSGGDFKILVNNKRLIGKYQNTQQWGTKRRSFVDLMGALMSNGSLTVNDNIEGADGKKHAVINKVETAAAQAKAEEITKEFQDWLWRDETRRKELADLYNETFNALVTPKYSGKNLTVNGLNAAFNLREHQADAVQRIISSGGNTLLAHKVGAGKTLEMAAAAMKMRELGIVKKPVFVVPKSLVAQWGVEFKSYFPASKLLVADENSFTKTNRKTFANRIANGDFDAVILSYEQFEKIPMSLEYKTAFYEQQIGEILDAIAEEKAENNGKGLTVKEMEKKKKQLEKKIADLTRKEKDEDNINFENLGIDSLFVDEAHNFKNLEYVTRMRNVSGLGNTNGSQRAFDLYTKNRYLQGLNGGRGIVFATATPVMNSMAEMYVMQKYLQSDMLDQLGLKTFDAWAKQFGEVVNSVEIKPSGQGFRVKQTFSNFRNLNELQLLFRSFSDVITQIPGLKIPKMAGGSVKTVVCEPGQFQQDFMKELEKRADNVKNVDPSEDNMLKITSDGRKVSYTQRMIDPSLPYEPGCKIYRCCENVLEEYKNSAATKGTQIIFCDMATPKGKSNAAKNADTAVEDDSFDPENASLYEDMKDYLVKHGIPAKEIAFIHDADTDAKKKQLFADVNDGKVRVLIGSTGKMGVGMNAQKRIVAIHHLDAPWRPGDVEQRDGRAFRQGNINEEVTKYAYVTEGSFDARLWDILDRKQHFIEQIMNGTDVGRSAEDTGDVTLSAAEVKALASGNPMIMEQVQLTNDIQKLNDLKKAYTSGIVAAKARLLEDEQKISTITDSISACKQDIKDRVDTYSDGKFSMKVGTSVFKEKKDAGAALAARIVSEAKEGEYTTVGEFAGFDLRVIKQGAEYIGIVSGKQGYRFKVYPENTGYMVNHIIDVVQSLESKLQNWQTRLDETETDLEAQKRMIAEPFSKQDELDEKMARYNEVMSILNPKEEQIVSDDEGETQYQLRPGAIDDINNAVSDKNVGGDIILTDNTPSILLSQKGVRNLPLAEKASHIRENVLTEQEAKALGLKIQKGTNYHGLGVSLYARVIDDLDSVSLAYRGTKNADDVSRRENYFLLISQHNDENGDRINVPVTIDQKRDVNHVFVDANLVNTVFGRKDLNDYIAEQVRKGNLVRIKYRSNANSEPPAPIAVDYTGIASKDSISQIDSNSQSKIQNQPRVSALTNRDVLDIKEEQIVSDDEGESDGEVQYQLRPVNPVQPTTQGWKRTKTTEEAMQAFPNMWNVSAEESETRNPTQIASTAGTYRKIYDILKSEGFSGKILDASSGLGIGTQVGRDEYGFDVEDIEPYPGTGYIPMYTDYSALGNKYDVIISSAVLNVLPQDQRDALVVKMGEMLNEDGRMFITTRGKDVETLAKSGKNIHLGDMEWIETVRGSYQKGFTNPELVLYLRDALGENFSVVPASKETGGKFNNNTNVVVTKLHDTQYQTRVSALTNRDVLDIASSSITVEELNDGEADSLRVFRGHLDTLREIEEQRIELGQLYREQQFGEHPDRAEAEKTLNRMRVLDDQIRRENEALLSIENKPVLQRVLEKSRKVIEQEERKHGQELLRRYRDRQKNAAEIRKYKERIKTDTDTLKTWILHPGNKNALQHVPDALKGSVIPFLSSIDFTSKRQLNGGAATKADVEFKKRLAAVQAAIKENKDIQGLYSGYSDLPEGFMDEMQKFVDAVNALPTGQEFIINQMTSDELKTLSRLVRVTKKLITQMNSFHNNAMFQHSFDAGESDISSMREFKHAPKTGVVSDFVLWQNMRPAYAFERFGEGGKSIFRELSGAYGTYALNTKKIVDFAEKVYTKEEANAWENDIKTFTLGEDTVRVPVSYIMGLYELNKRPQAREHLLVGGLRVASFKGKKSGNVTDTGHTLTQNDIDTMIGTLTERQKAVADMLQQYMAKQGGEWGNYVSVARFGEEQFGEEHYYPINSDGQHLKATADEMPSAASLYALLNMSFTKELQEGANNRVILYSIFDVFANHMASMAQYNAFALPVLDSLKWLNYQQRAEDVESGETPTSVREQMARAFGVPAETRPGSGRRSYAESFVLNIIKALNGTETQGIATDNMGINALHRYNMAQVAYNLRVVVQQPMAITRAGLIIDYGSIIRGLSLSPKAIRANVREMYEHNGIAAWKGLGFYDVNISRSLTDIIKHNESFMDKVGEFGMMGAEKADEITWAAIWNACKKEVERKQHLSPKDARYFDAVNDLFDEVIYKTQVVDSVLTKSEFLRSKGAWARAVGSFMSEPTTTASMVFDAVSRYNMDIRRGMSKSEAWKQNKTHLGRTFYVYAVSAVLLSVVEALADAWRDDDDYANYFEKWFKEFKSNLLDEAVIFNKLPLASDAYDLVKSVLDAFGVDTYGNAPRSVLFQWRDSLIKACEIFHDKIKGDGKNLNYTWYGGTYKLLQALSGMSGLPAATLTREVVGAWNNIVPVFAPSLKVKSYDSGAESNIKYAYQDGYLTEDEAIAKLVEDGGMEQSEAKSTVAKWKYGDWDTDGNGLTQAEASYALESSDFSQTEKEAIWNSFGWKADYEDVQDKAKARIELDENAVTYNSDNWMDGLQDTTLSDGDKDALVNAYGSTWFASPYRSMRESGFSPAASYNLLMSMDDDGNQSIKQAEAYGVLKNYSDAEAASIWDSFGWKTDYYTYRAKQ